MRINDLFEAAQSQVVIYPGRFQPFHRGHASVYQWLANKFDHVFIATSNKVDPPRSPFNFEEKKRMMLLAGVPASAIVQVKNPYAAEEIISKFDPETTVVIFAVSEKDMAEDPRFQFKPKKDGSPGYLQKYGGEMQPLNKHGYVMTVPTFDFSIAGEPMRSATELRRNFAVADTETQAQMIKDLYGKYDPEIHRLMVSKLAPQ